MASDFVSELISDVKAGYAEGKADYLRRTTPLSYWCHLYEEFNYSATEFYGLVQQHLEQRAVPDLVMGGVSMREGTIFSRRRLYLELRRERFVFQICAAPFGKGWFVSSRLFDRRQGAKFWHFLFVFLLVNFISGILTLLLGVLVTLAILGTLFTLLWSLMRLAASESMAHLDDLLCQVPVLGRIYETLFHPDTYFRQDQRNMYREAVHRALMAALGELQNQKGLKPLSELESRPALAELQR